MAINPNDVTTVQVKDLPPNPFSLTDNIPHEVGGILSRGTISELINFITAQSKAFKYEIKYIRAPDTQYINDNFDMTPNATQGIGKVGGMYEGWAICNGNNGTDNLDGQAFIGYGANYATVGQFLGEKEHLLTIPELPSHAHGFQALGSVTSNKTYKFGSNGDFETNFESLVTAPTGGGLAHNNMQPSFVILMIMKIV